MTIRNLILHIEPEFNIIDVQFNKTFSGNDWCKKLICKKQELYEKYDFIISSHSLLYKKNISNNNKSFSIGVLCNTKDEFILAEKSNIDFDIIFSPTKLTILESHTNSNQTICAKIFLSKGMKLTKENLAFINGGEGVSSSLLDLIIGNTVAYDIQPNEAIDFGKLE